MDSPTIYVRRSDDAFLVSVEPSQPGIEDWPAKTHRDARGFASGLRLTHRWSIVDLASDAALSDMIGGTK